jgi:hypothetical protein
MNRSVSRYLACVAMAGVLAFCVAGTALAKGGTGGGGGGGGGTAVPPPVPRSALSISSGLNTLGPVGSDQAVFLTVTALGDDRDAPVITMTSGPAGLILNNLLPSADPHGGINGHTLASYMWTPGRSDIGQTFQATFTATTQSGAAVSTTVAFGTVQDVPPATVSGLTATTFADHIEAHWNPSATGDRLTYTLVACYNSVLVGTTIPGIFCDSAGNTQALELLDIPTGPATNLGLPGQSANYYGLFLNAWSGFDGHLMGRVSVNLP